MRLDERKENILDFIVRDYIDTATPVSSGRMASRIKKEQASRTRAASPATLRNIMLELDEEGFLHQPHTSAGRAPTEKGYRYFINYLMESCDPDIEIKSEVDAILEEFADESENVFHELSRALARHLKLFSGVSLVDEGRVFSHGLPETLREPEFFLHSEAVRFADFAENIGENIKKFSGSSPEVDAGGFGMVKIVFRDSNLGECIIFSAGPQRMNYEKAESVLKYAVEDITNKRNKHAKRR